MRGRYPSGPEFVNKLNGSASAKERLQVLLETLAGERRIGEACDRLGISEPRFDQIRIESLQAALSALDLVRAEIAVTLPQVNAGAEKKTTRPRRRRRPRARKPS